jgi:hypothetical protein
MFLGLSLSVFPWQTSTYKVQSTMLLSQSTNVPCFGNPEECVCSAQIFPAFSHFNIAPLHVSLERLLSDTLTCLVPPHQNHTRSIIIVIVIFKHFYVQCVPCFRYHITFFPSILYRQSSQRSSLFHFQEIWQHPKCHGWWIWRVHCRIQWLPPSTT